MLDTLDSLDFSEESFQEFMATDPNVQAWKQEYLEEYGEEPQIDNNPYFDYREAFKRGDKPQLNTTDNKYHWGSAGKSDKHPTKWKQDVVEETGVNPDESGLDESSLKRLEAFKNLSPSPEDLANYIAVLKSDQDKNKIGANPLTSGINEDIEAEETNHRYTDWTEENKDSVFKAIDMEISGTASGILDPHDIDYNFTYEGQTFMGIDWLNPDDEVTINNENMDKFLRGELKMEDEHLDALINKKVKQIQQDQYLKDIEESGHAKQIWSDDDVKAIEGILKEEWKTNLKNARHTKKENDNFQKVLQEEITRLESETYTPPLIGIGRGIDQTPFSEGGYIGSPQYNKNVGYNNLVTKTEEKAVEDFRENNPDFLAVYEAQNKLAELYHDYKYDPSPINERAYAKQLAIVEDLRNKLQFGGFTTDLDGNFIGGMSEEEASGYELRATEMFEEMQMLYDLENPETLHTLKNKWLKVKLLEQSLQEKYDSFWGENSQEALKAIGYDSNKIDDIGKELFEVKLRAQALDHLYLLNHRVLESQDAHKSQSFRHFGKGFWQGMGISDATTTSMIFNTDDAKDQAALNIMQEVGIPVGDRDISATEMSGGEQVGQFMGDISSLVVKLYVAKGIINPILVGSPRAAAFINTTNALKNSERTRRALHTVAKNGLIGGWYNARVAGGVGGKFVEGLSTWQKTQVVLAEGLFEEAAFQAVGGHTGGGFGFGVGHRLKIFGGWRPKSQIGTLFNNFVVKRLGQATAATTSMELAGLSEAAYQMLAYDDTFQEKFRELYPALWETESGEDGFGKRILFNLAMNSILSTSQAYNPMSMGNVIRRNKTYNSKTGEYGISGIQMIKDQWKRDVTTNKNELIQAINHFSNSPEYGGKGKEINADIIKEFKNRLEDLHNFELNAENYIWKSVILNKEALQDPEGESTLGVVNEAAGDLIVAIHTAAETKGPFWKKKVTKLINEYNELQQNVWNAEPVNAKDIISKYEGAHSTSLGSKSAANQKAQWNKLTEPQKKQVSTGAKNRGYQRPNIIAEMFNHQLATETARAKFLARYGIVRETIFADNVSHKIKLNKHTNQLEQYWTRRGSDGQTKRLSQGEIDQLRAADVKRAEEIFIREKVNFENKDYKPLSEGTGRGTTKFVVEQGNNNISEQIAQARKEKAAGANNGKTIRLLEYLKKTVNLLPKEVGGVNVVVHNTPGSLNSLILQRVAEMKADAIAQLNTGKFTEQDFAKEMMEIRRFAENASINPFVVIAKENTIHIDTTPGSNLSKKEMGETVLHELGHPLLRAIEVMNPMAYNALEKQMMTDRRYKSKYEWALEAYGLTPEGIKVATTSEIMEIQKTVLNETMAQWLGERLYKQHLSKRIDHVLMKPLNAGYRAIFGGGIVDFFTKAGLDTSTLKLEDLTNLTKISNKISTALRNDVQLKFGDDVLNTYFGGKERGKVDLGNVNHFNLIADRTLFKVLNESLSSGKLKGEERNEAIRKLDKLNIARTMRDRGDGALKIYEETGFFVNTDGKLLDYQGAPYFTTEGVRAVEKNILEALSKLKESAIKDEKYIDGEYNTEWLVEFDSRTSNAVVEVKLGEIMDGPAFLFYPELKETTLEFRIGGGDMMSHWWRGQRPISSGFSGNWGRPSLSLEAASAIKDMPGGIGRELLGGRIKIDLPLNIVEGFSKAIKEGNTKKAWRLLQDPAGKADRKVVEEEYKNPSEYVTSFGARMGGFLDAYLSQGSFKLKYNPSSNVYGFERKDIKPSDTEEMWRNTEKIINTEAIGVDRGFMNLLVHEIQHNIQYLERIAGIPGSQHGLAPELTKNVLKSFYFNENFVKNFREIEKQFPRQRHTEKEIKDIIENIQSGKYEDAIEVIDNTVKGKERSGWGDVMVTDYVKKVGEANELSNQNNYWLVEQMKTPEGQMEFFDLIKGQANLPKHVEMERTEKTLDPDGNPVWASYSLYLVHPVTKGRMELGHFNLMSRGMAGDTGGMIADPKGGFQDRIYRPGKYSFSEFSLEINTGSIPKWARGVGLGKLIYQTLQKKAQETGHTIRTDGGPSEKAQRVWESMKRKGLLEGDGTDWLYESPSSYKERSIENEIRGEEFTYEFFNIRKRLEGFDLVKDVDFNSKTSTEKYVDYMIYMDYMNAFRKMHAGRDAQLTNVVEKVANYEIEILQEFLHNSLIETGNYAKLEKKWEKAQAQGNLHEFYKSNKLHAIFDIIHSEVTGFQAQSKESLSDLNLRIEELQSSVKERRDFIARGIEPQRGRPFGRIGDADVFKRGSSDQYFLEMVELEMLLGIKERIRIPEDIKDQKKRNFYNLGKEKIDLDFAEMNFLNLANRLASLKSLSREYETYLRVGGEVESRVAEQMAAAEAVERHTYEGSEFQKAGIKSPTKVTGRRMVYDLASSLDKDFTHPPLYYDTATDSYTGKLLERADAHQNINIKGKQWKQLPKLSKFNVLLDQNFQSPLDILERYHGFTLENGANYKGYDSKSVNLFFNRSKVKTMEDYISMLGRFKYDKTFISKEKGGSSLGRGKTWDDKTADKLRWTGKIIKAHEELDSKTLHEAQDKLDGYRRDLFQLLNTEKLDKGEISATHENYLNQNPDASVAEVEQYIRHWITALGPVEMGSQYFKDNWKTNFKALNKLEEFGRSKFKRIKTEKEAQMLADIEMALDVLEGDGYKKGRKGFLARWFGIDSEIKTQGWRSRWNLRALQEYGTANIYSLVEDLSINHSQSGTFQSPLVHFVMDNLRNAENQHFESKQAVLNVLSNKMREIYGLEEVKRSTINPLSAEGPLSTNEGRILNRLRKQEQKNKQEETIYWVDEVTGEPTKEGEKWTPNQAANLYLKTLDPTKSGSLETMKIFKKAFSLKKEYETWENFRKSSDYKNLEIEFTESTFNGLRARTVEQGLTAIDAARKRKVSEAMDITDIIPEMRDKLEEALKELESTVTKNWGKGARTVSKYPAHVQRKRAKELKEQHEIEVKKLRDEAEARIMEAHRVWEKGQELINKKAKEKFEADTGQGFVLTNKGKAILDLVDPKLKQWADYLIEEFFPQYAKEEMFPGFKPLDTFFRELYGMPLPINPRYSPLLTEVDASSTDRQIDLSSPQGIYSQMSSGHFKGRKQSKQPIAKQDIGEMVTQFVQNMEYFKAFQQPVSNIHNVFNSRVVKEKIQKDFSPSIHGAINKAIIDIAKQNQEYNWFLSQIMKLRTNYVVGSLGAKPSLAIKQATSMVAYAGDIPTASWLKYTSELLNPGTDKELSGWRNAYNTLMELPFMRKRYHRLEFDDAVKQVMGSDYEHIPSHGGAIVKQIVNKLMSPVIAGDRFAIVAGGWGVYKHTYDQAIKEGKTEEQARSVAEKRFENATRLAQQASEASDLSAMQRNPYLKWFTMYKTSPFSYFRQSRAALRAISAGKGSKRENYKKFMIYHVILPQLFQAATTGFALGRDKWVMQVDDGEMEDKLKFGTDPSDILKFMLPFTSSEVSDKYGDVWKAQKRAGYIGSLNGLFILGDILNWGANLFVEDKRFNLHMIPMESAVESIGRGGKALFDGYEDLKAQSEAGYEITAADIAESLILLNKVADPTFTLMGLPYRGVYKMQEGIRARFEQQENYWDPTQNRFVPEELERDYPNITK